MDKEDFKLFPVLVTRYKNFITTEQADSIFRYGQKLNIKEHPGWVGDAKSSHHITENFLKDIENNIRDCQGIIDDLTFIVNLYSKQFGYHKDLQIYNSWYNIQQPNSVLKMHTHPQSIFSAVLFVKCDDLSSHLLFQNPNMYLSYLNTALEGNVDYNMGVSSYENFGFKPEVGDLILFPSWLKHGSLEQINQGLDRMSISFNCRFV